MNSENKNIVHKRKIVIAVSKYVGLKIGKYGFLKLPIDIKQRLYFVIINY